MSEPVERGDLDRLRSRGSWSGHDDADDGARARAECERAPRGHLDVVLDPAELPRCGHCGATLSPDALRRAGIKARRS